MNNLMAQALANADDKDQAEFLNEFVSCLRDLCRATASYGIGMQIHAIAQLLRSDTAEFIKELSESYAYSAERCCDVVIKDKQEQIWRLEKRIEELKAAAAEEAGNNL